MQSFEEARSLGLIERMPRFHAVQTEACHPLERAHRLLSLQILEESGRPAAPKLHAETNAAAALRAERIARDVPPERIDEALHHAATHRSRFMWPWGMPRRSLAGGILDDETYDWLAVASGMLSTGGFPVVVAEHRLREAQDLAERETTIPSSSTGTAGLAGLVELLATGLVAPGEKTLVLFTGAPGT
jgi:threonine synthase